MRRHGYTVSGRQRWCCLNCSTTNVHRRPDTRQRHLIQRARQWLIGKASVRDIAVQRKTTRQSLSKQFRTIFAQPATWTTPQQISVLVLDGIYIHRRALMALVGLAEGQKLVWSFATRETSESWFELLNQLPEPRVVVCDGQTGLLACLKALWPQAAIQRCHFHVLKLTRVYLTSRPKTEAGQELSNLLRTLVLRRTPDQVVEFKQLFQTWCQKYHNLLAERSGSTDAQGKKHWWYTHRKLRGARSLILHALPHLFTFLDYPNCPNTTNQVEGGINSQIAEALRLHRGLRIHQKPTLISFILVKINSQKTTRKVT